VFKFLRKKIGKFEQQIESELQKSKEDDKTIETQDTAVEAKITQELKQAVKQKKHVQKISRERHPFSISKKKLDSLLWDLEIGLLESDVALPVVEEIKDNIKEQLSHIRSGSAKDVVRHALMDAISNVLISTQVNFQSVIENSSKPVVLMFVGVNGTGKTTAIAKLCYHLQKMGNSCVISASDTFRAGAIEQLEQHAANLGVKLIKHKAGADPAAVAYDAIQHAKARCKDIVLLDTAGRMQTNINLMDEMKKIRRVAQPNMVIFVGDALTGNDAVEQAKKFDEIVGIDGIILTKVDADAKGGAALSIAYTIGKPLLFVGVGQEYDDQIPFDPEWMMKRIFEE
jgi:fused signal recognition particle receptor